MKTDTGLGEWVIRFRWWIIVATLLMVAAGASGIRSLGFTNNYRLIKRLGSRAYPDRNTSVTNHLLPSANNMVLSQ